jgi:alpha-amylase/alpha-mannosidase (GH57 family)
MDRYICIHGHFYQPPRENPWLEAIEVQDSAYPYHDWNERINVECYAANGMSRIMDGQGRIIKVVNNYPRLSFNFGPTLLNWIMEYAPETYQAILEAHRESRVLFSGHSSALAQAYNHMILPLANARDKLTQVVWGKADYEARFKAAPEGMWLPETAVDQETLEVLADQGIRFVILAPHQAARARKIGTSDWQDVSGGRIDPTMAYTTTLRTGKKIALFFYDGPTSQAVAFEKLLAQGDRLANRLAQAFSDRRAWPQLVHIATDGETYGHHHKFGNMALSYALRYIEEQGLAKLTNYGEFLERFPPTHEAEIIENTAWSCAHGVERWRSDCGCNTGGHPGWNQAWRAPLRKALDWLRDSAAPRYEEKARELFKDPWDARNHYLSVILDRSPENIEKFLAAHQARPLKPEEKVRAMKLMEMQRHALLMYTSCGWFFDDVSGIETIQILQYAGRVIQLGRELLGDALEPRFLEILGQARSNDPACGDGRTIYEKHVRPAMLDLPKVGAHYAVSSLFEDYPEKAGIYSFGVELADYRREEAGRANLVVGRARIVSRITLESACFEFGLLHLGDHNVNAGVREAGTLEEYKLLSEEIIQVFSRADLPEVIRILDRGFHGAAYNLKSLFRDQQRKIISILLHAALKDGEAVFRQFFEYHAPLMRFLIDLGAPMPRGFSTVAKFIITQDLERIFDTEFDPHRVSALLDEAKALRISLDAVELGYALQKAIEKEADRLREQPDQLSRLDALLLMTDLARTKTFQVNLWNAQNAYWRMARDLYPSYKQKYQKGEEGIKDWLARFAELGKKLSVIAD